MFDINRLTLITLIFLLTLLLYGYKTHMIQWNMLFLTPTSGFYAICIQVQVGFEKN